MAETIRTDDLCVIGGGAAGLSVAAAAGLMQAPTVLIEKGRMGGECLNAGCVPSKALTRAAKQAEAMRRAPAFGFAAVEPKPAHNRVQAHSAASSMRSRRSTAPNASGLWASR